MAYKYDPKTGEFVDTAQRSARTTASSTAPRQRVQSAAPSPAPYRTRRQDPRTTMSTVYGGTSRYRTRKSEYYKWWIIRMCVYVGIAMLFNLCSR